MLEWFLAYINNFKKKPFGEQLYKYGIIIERVARSRIKIDAAHFAVPDLLISKQEASFWAIKQAKEGLACLFIAYM